MDELYLQKVKNGDHNAFSYFVRTYKETAYGIAFSVLKNTLDAEDVVQEAFIKIYKGIRAYNSKSKFSTWLYRIVVNEAFKKIKKEKKHLHNTITELEINNANKESFSLEKKEQKYYINLCLEALSASYSLVLDLFYIKEYSIKEVCEITSWSLSKTKVTLHRARNQFYVELKKQLKSEVKVLQYFEN